MNKANQDIGAHSDFECFTILNQLAPGLQVMNAADEWVEAPPTEGTFIVNAGDLLEGWTNGLFKETQHRVVNTGRERFSLPLPGKKAWGSFARSSHSNYFRTSPKRLRRRVLSGDLKIDVPIRAENPFKRRAVNEYKDTSAR